MKKGDIIIGLVLLSIGIFLSIEYTRNIFISFNARYKLIGGFLKFFVLASIGDLIGGRIKNKKWSIPLGFLKKAIIWGLIGMVIVLIFGIYSSGVTYLMLNEILPFDGSKLAHAFFVSLIMNLTFAPTMMAFHRITDKVIDLKTLKEYHNLASTVKSIDWSQFVSFVILITIPFFWIPAHTITFLLPEEYQVLFASILGICLGMILGISKRKSLKNNNAF
ncbi:Mpv17/PMP22 family protein [Mycoplasmatota bacterium]|nr:Mpv17/PMP22 family protein [Mycoplasmatota bacterium]